MEIIKIEPFKGRNIYSHRPVIRAVADLGGHYDTPTRQIEGFNERLLEMLPGLAKHVCSLGYEGGFAERLAEGTYLAHVAEHMVLELQGMLGFDVHYGKSRIAEEPSIYHIIFEYKNEKTAIECLLAVSDMINMLIAGKMPDIVSIKSTWKGSQPNPAWDQALKHCMKRRARGIFPLCAWSLQAS